MGLGITDGWAAGLLLAARSLRKVRDPRPYLDHFAENLVPGKDSSITDYLQQSMADHLDEAELAFLVRISACQRFNRELCEFIIDDERAGILLTKLAAKNLFIIPTDLDGRVQ